MHYLKLTDEIVSYINQIPEVKSKKIFIGCKPHCNSQIIALDELELMRKLLKQNEIKDFSSEEFKSLKNSTRMAYFLNTHICQELPKSVSEKESEQERLRIEQEEFIKELSKDKIPEKEKPSLFDPKIDYEYLSKRQEEHNLEAIGRNSFSFKESNLSYGISIIGSFFLIIMGIYYFCQIVLGLSKETTLKVTIVCSIIVLIAEAVLLMMRLDKESKKEIRGKKLNKKSFAYQFNLKYKEKVDNEIAMRKERYLKNKVHQKEKTE